MKIITKKHKLEKAAKGHAKNIEKRGGVVDSINKVLDKWEIKYHFPTK